MAVIIVHCTLWSAFSLVDMWPCACIVGLHLQLAYDAGVSYTVSLLVLTCLWCIVIFDSLCLFPKISLDMVCKNGILTGYGL